MSFDLRDVAPNDDDYLLDLYASTRDAELSATPWTEDQKHDFIRMQFDAQRRDYETRFPDATHSLIRSGSRSVGRIWIDRRPQETRLLDITIHPSERNRGIGSMAIEWLQEEAKATLVPLRHSVYASNVGALRFYRRHGFAVIEDFGAYVLMEWSPGSVTAG